MSAGSVPMEPGLPRIGAWRATLLATATGLLLALAQIDMAPLAWVALAPLTLAVLGLDLLTAFSLGMWSGAVAGAANYGMLTYGWLIYAMVVAYCGLNMGAYAALVARSHRLPAWGFALVPALAWTALEILRRMGPVAYPIDMASTQVGLPILIQSARLVGADGVSFLVALPSGLLVLWALGRGPSKGLVAAVVALELLSVAYGVHRLTLPTPDAPRVRVSALQTGFPNWLYAVETVSEPHHALVERVVFGMTERAAKLGTDLVLWPETALHTRVLELPSQRDRLMALAKETHTAIIAGFFRENSRGQEHNSAVLFDPSGRIQPYDKRRLASLAEWRITPGESNHPLDTSFGPVGLLICLESLFAQDAVELTARGAQLLAVTTNDAGFLLSPISSFHLARSRLRAIESGRYLVHLSQAGPSAILDPEGRTIVGMGLFVGGNLTGTVGLIRERTWFHRHPDLFPALVFAALVALVWWSRRPREGRRTQGTVSETVR